MQLLVRSMFGKLPRLFSGKSSIVVGDEPKLSAIKSDLRLPSKLFFDQDWPKISVVTPTYNQGKYIEETIESVIAQKYPNLEFIIVDGGSTDATLSIIEKYKEFINIVISEPDNGQSHAINKGFALATGEILTWLNSDDCLAVGALAAVAVAFASQPSDIVCGVCEVYKDGKLIDRHLTSCANGLLPLNELLDLEGAWKAGQFFYQPEVFFRRALWEKAGGHVREDYYYSMDYELWCRFALVGATMHVVGTPLVRYRTHAEQKTAIAEKYEAELEVVRKAFLEANKIPKPKESRPPINFSRKLKIALVNDLGRKYGAGIAHGRISDSFKMAGHTTIELNLDATKVMGGDVNEQKIIKEIKRFNPDLVVFGNLHGALKNSATIVDVLSNSFNTMTVVHDFWMFTGRCAYTEDCTKFLTGCDQSCPTTEQYPVLKPSLIKNAWVGKRKIWSKPNPPIIVGYSRWAHAQASKMTSNIKNKALQIEQVRLGAPSDLFIPLDKAKAREHFAITAAEFVVAFSVSSLSEVRKGGEYLRETLSKIEAANVTLMLIGNQDIQLDFKVGRVISLGYVTDTSQIVLALNASDVYVGPSLNETLGQVFIEAALSGIPSIGFTGSGVEDAIADGITGYLVPRTSKALCQAIMKLYDDRELCANMGQWARLYARNEFSTESMYHSFFVIWRKLGLVDKWKAAHKIRFPPQ
jgi:glycosyltransferase involved in cell wall biosynthesis